MKIAFQGAKGAYSDMACREVFADAETIPSNTFDDAFQAVKNGAVDYAMIPIENTLAGRVADVHHLLPKSGLFIIGEHFLPVHHCLMGVKGAAIDQLKNVHSHVHALPQCRNFMRDNQLNGVVHADTAGAAKDIAALGDPTQAAIASRLAAEIYGLEILAADIEDDHTNTTRFVILAPTRDIPTPSANIMTSLMFELRHIPAALFKAIGGFATNGVNMMKLESYVDSAFNVAKFYCEIEGHPEDLGVKRALEELNFFAKTVDVLGVYEKSSFRELLPQ